MRERASAGRRSIDRSLRHHGGLIEMVERRLLLAADFQWAAGFGGGVQLEYADSVATDAAGNVYATGGFAGTVDSDPGPGVRTLTSNSNASQFYVAKYGPTGDLAWAHTFAGSTASANFARAGEGIGVDAEGNVYTAGKFIGVTDFDPGPNATLLGEPGTSAVFLSKLDADGNFVWAGALPSSGTSFPFAEIYDLGVDPAGNVYAGGLFRGTLDLDPGPGTAAVVNTDGLTINAFIAKVDRHGQLVWGHRVGGGGLSEVFSVAADGAGGVVVAGKSAASSDMDPGPGVVLLPALSDTSGIPDFVAKYNANGVLTWARRTGGDTVGEITSLDVAVAGDGSVITTGMFFGTADLDPGAGTHLITSRGNWDIYVLKLSAAGNLVWASGWGSADYDPSGDVAVGPDGSVYTTSILGGKADVDPGPGTYELGIALNTTTVISRLSPAGAFMYAGAVVGVRGFAIAADPLGGVAVGGQYFGTVDADPGEGTYPITAALSGSFLLRLTNLELTSAEYLARLTERTVALELARGQETSVLAQLAAAGRFIENEEDQAKAATHLENFIRLVEQLLSKAFISVDERDALVSAAQALLARL